MWLLGLGSVLAVVFGHISRHRDRQAGARPNGLALAGLIIGYVGLCFSLPVLMAAAIPTFLAQQDAADDALLRSELRNAAIAQEAWSIGAGSYTSSVTDLTSTGYSPDPSVQVEIVRADAASYCLSAQLTSSDETLYLSSADATPSTAACG